MPPPDPHHRVRALSSALALPSSLLRGGVVHDFPPPSPFRPQPFARPVSVTFLRPPSSALRPSPSALLPGLPPFSPALTPPSSALRPPPFFAVHWCTDAGKTCRRLTLSHLVSREKRLPSRQTRSASRSLVMISNPDPAFSANQKASFGRLPRKTPRSVPPMFSIAPRRGSMSEEVAQPCLRDLPGRRKARARSRAEHRYALGRRTPSNERSSSARPGDTETCFACQSDAEQWRHRRHQGAIRRRSGRHQGAIWAPSGRHLGAITRIPERLGRHDAIFQLFFVRVPSPAFSGEPAKWMKDEG